MLVDNIRKTPNKIESLKLGQSIKCKFADDRFRMEKTENHNSGRQEQAFEECGYGTK